MKYQRPNELPTLVARVCERPYWLEPELGSAPGAGAVVWSTARTGASDDAVDEDEAESEEVEGPSNDDPASLRTS